MRPFALFSAFLTIVVAAESIPAPAPCSPDGNSRSTALPTVEELSAPGPRTLRALRRNPTTLESEAERRRVNGTERLVATADMHAVYNVPMEYFAEAITDLSDHDLFLPSVTGSSELCRSNGSSPFARQHVTTSVGVLFFRATYDNVIDVFVTRLPEEPSLLSRHTLHESRDGKLHELNGFWYLEEISINGEAATYVRRKSRTVFAEERLGLKAALNSFSTGELKKLFDAVHEEAQRRQSRAR